MRFLIWLSALTLFYCSTPKVTQQPDELTSDILNLMGSPDNLKDRSVSTFSDLGAWYSIALPEVEKKGSLVGPFIMTQQNGVWLGESIAHLTIKDDQGESLPIVNYEGHSYPGRLEQQLIFNGLKVKLTAIFVTNKTTLINAEISNTGSGSKDIIINWEGDIWLPKASFSQLDHLTIRFEDYPHLAKYGFENQGYTVSSSNTNYSAHSNVITIEGGETINTNLTYSLVFNDQEMTEEDEKVKSIMTNPSLAISENKDRWQGYLNQFPYHSENGLTKPEFVILKTKAIQTLVNNWRSKAGELKHDGLFPSYRYSGFHGFWAWDSWKHAVALAHFEPNLAKDQIRAMYDYQNDRGMIADCIFRDTLIENHNWRDTKPPLSGWSIWEVFKQTHDTSFVEEMLPKLESYHRWWYLYRDNDQNGICEFGSPDGTRVAAAWESGMDNAVRFDSAVMLRNNQYGWSLNQESVDLNAYLYSEKLYLKQLNDVLGNLDKSSKYAQEAVLLKSRINDAFYDQNKGYYFDRVLGTHNQIDIVGPEGWIPLWSGIPSDQQAKNVSMHLMDTALLNGFVPLPTLNLKHPKLDPLDGYWRGPVWIDQAYFAIIGLRKYGYLKEANLLQGKLLRNAKGLLDKGVPIRENYHPITGEGLNAHHFSWSAAHILLMLKDH